MIGNLTTHMNWLLMSNLNMPVVASLEKGVKLLRQNVQHLALFMFDCDANRHAEPDYNN
jgi:hypothetical protein